MENKDCADQMVEIIQDVEKLRKFRKHALKEIIQIRERCKSFINYLNEKGGGKKMLKLSVIVPVYKAEQYLKRCIDSILGQNYKNIELILVDDGSPDACPGICDQYQERMNEL